MRDVPTSRALPALTTLRNASIVLSIGVVRVPTMDLIEVDVIGVATTKTGTIGIVTHATVNLSIDHHFLACHASPRTTRPTIISLLSCA